MLKDATPEDSEFLEINPERLSEACRDEYCKVFSVLRNFESAIVVQAETEEVQKVMQER